MIDGVAVVVRSLIEKACRFDERLDQVLALNHHKRGSSSDCMRLTKFLARPDGAMMP
jgi:hypothetical protein